MIASKNCFAVLILIISAYSVQATVITMNYLERLNISFKNETLQEPKIVKSCQNIGICGKVINYPDDLVTRLLKELNENNVMNSTIERIYEANAYGKRMCSHEPKIAIPRGAQDENGTWYYVLNPKSGSPFQQYQIETCINEGVCEKANNAQNKYTIYCKQIFNYKSMVYLDIENQTLGIKKLAVPNCCSCSLRPRR